MNTTTTLNTKYIGGLGITYLVDCKDDIINVDTSQGVCTIILPNITQNGLNSIPKSFFINDITLHTPKAGRFVKFAYLF